MKDISVPQTLHELLRLALDDFDKVSQLPDVVINMTTWHKYIDGKCHVCLAGAVMHRTFQIGHDHKLSYDKHFGLEWDNAFNALNRLRIGNVAKAHKEYHNIPWDAQNCPKAKSLNRVMCSYRDFPSIWRSQMEQLYNDLKEANL